MDVKLLSLLLPPLTQDIIEYAENIDVYTHGQREDEDHRGEGRQAGRQV